jgi:hypothetical protein
MRLIILSNNIVQSAEDNLEGIGETLGNKQGDAPPSSAT